MFYSVYKNHHVQILGLQIGRIDNGDRIKPNMVPLNK